MSESFVQGSSNPNSVTPIGVQKDMKCLLGANIKKGNFLSGRVQLSQALSYGNKNYDKFSLVSRNLNILFIVESDDGASNSYGTLYLDAYDLSTFELLYSTELEGRHIAYHQSRNLLATAGGKGGNYPTNYHIYTATRTGLSLLYSGNDGLRGDAQYTNVCFTDNFLVFNGHKTSYSMTAVNLSTGAKTTTQNTSVSMKRCRMVYAGNEYILAANFDSDYDNTNSTRVHLLKVDGSGNITYPVNNVNEPIGLGGDGFFFWCSEWGKAVYGRAGATKIDVISFTESSITCSGVKLGSSSSGPYYPSPFTFYPGGVSYVDFPEVSSIDVISTSGTHLVSIYSDGSYTQTAIAANNNIFLCGMDIMPVGMKTDDYYPVVFSLSRVTVGAGSSISIQNASFNDTFKAVSHS